MLSRRKFSACAICAMAGFTAIEIVGEARAAGGIERKILQKVDFPDKYATITALVEIDAAANVARHTHPGVESAYILEGGIEVTVKGQPAKKFGPGDSFQIAAETPHSARNGDKPTKALVTYVVERDKPLASPAPE